MAESAMINAKNETSKDVDLWLMDGSGVEYPADFKDLEPLPKELEEKVRAIADKILGPVDEVQSAA